ncbi:NAD(+)/NADH kinase [Pelagicoccus albus]|uniref:NAD kinase n=1 Tax=Pelagicoccus albus TaxID=415222 RepID=A0A7X1B3T5_9BACT|nr:NAD(+)/NADH kinase [Pelagicoccus albus]MBC2605123.1 NAD(+)/NADH kinase [Pelagicoccus albus]
MAEIKQLAFVINGSKNGSRELVEVLAEIAEVNGVKTKSITGFPVPHGAFSDMDACCVVGGDGTFLSAAAEATRCQIPVIGVNRGTLGFLTTYTSEEVAGLFPSVLKGEFKAQERTLLECSAQDSHTDLALNDVVIKAADSSQIIHINVFADDEFVTTYVCDGLIFATPTGSTAYTLSAGGPLMHPAAEAISLTPICPHTLSNRSIIFPSDKKLRIENAKPGQRLLVALDGQRNLNILEGSSLCVSVSEHRLKIAQKLDYSHFNVVRHKLKWSGGYAGEI